MAYDSLVRDTLLLVKDFISEADIANKLEQARIEEQWFENKIFIAFVAATFTQLLGEGIKYLMRKRDFDKKKKMILTDLAEKKRLLNDELLGLDELSKQLKQGDASTFQSLFQYELNSKVFESVTKPELFRIFGSNVILLTNIYTAIDHQRDHGALEIFNRYSKFKDEIHSSKIGEIPKLREDNLERARHSEIANCTLRSVHIKEIIDNIDKVITT